jgi:hypothetical protein
LVAVLLPLREVHAQGTEQAEQTGASLLLIGLGILFFVTLAGIAYWLLGRTGRSRRGKEQLALWLGLPVLGLVLFLFLVGGFNACGG